MKTPSQKPRPSTPSVQARTRPRSAPAKARASWVPTLPDNGEPIYSQLLSVLETDIAAGRLVAGAPMPTQRELAKALGISAGTVIKAYAEAERLGLVQGQVGRGTFVKGRGHPAGQARPMIDLSLNLPGARVPAAVLSASLARAAKRADLVDFTGYTSHQGILEHRQALASVAGPGDAAAVDNMFITLGAQHSMVLALGAVCRHGDTVLTEAATYHGMKALADFLGLRLQGVAMDGEGLRPDLLDEAVRQSGARVLFTMPTLQNPTARTMGATRRRDIIKVARKHDLLIVEDDVYGFFAPGVAPLARSAPERTFYINSLSKCVMPGLRVGVLVAPPAHLQEVSRAMRATAWMGSPFASLIAADWVRDGTVARIVELRHEDAIVRTRIARAALGDALPPSLEPSFHVWLELPVHEAARVSQYATHHGVVTTPMSACIVDPTRISGLRLSIGAPEKVEDLERALGVLADGLRDDAGQRTSFI